MQISDLIKFYSRKEIREKIISLAKDREVVVRFNDKVGKRPDSIMYEDEIIELARNGATSFHASMERWRNPLLLRQDMKRNELNDLRIGWDLIIDIDCPYLEYSKICAHLLCEAIEFHGIKNYSIKFSGGSGFHIGIPFESFPKEINNKEMKILFPEAARIVINYLKEMIKEKLGEEILDYESIKRIIKKTGKSFNELVKNGVFDPYELINIDILALSSRHLFRMPYTFNEKTWLVSIPIKKENILSFNKKEAEYQKVEAELCFLEKFKENEAKELFIQAFDWNASEEAKKEIDELKKYKIPESAIGREFFPPCIKNIYKGLEDGRKRSLFILINFLKNMGWNFESIEKEIIEWNKRNKEPLRESYINSQLNWHKRVKVKYLPPSCENKNYYVDIGVCDPDFICKKIKNPVIYPIKKMVKKNGRSNFLRGAKKSAGARKRK